MPSSQPQTEPPSAVVEAHDHDRCPVCGATLGPPELVSHDRLHGLPGTYSVARCTSCGVGVTLPLADAREIAAFYPRSYGAYQLPRGVAGFISRLIRTQQERQALRSAPLTRLTQLPPGRLLEVGSGRGDLASWFLNRGWSVTGVEPSVEACEVARCRGVDARVGTLDEVLVESAAYDAVVFRQSLEHVTDPVADLRRALSALRPGGSAIISVPNFGCWQRRVFGGAWFHLDLPRHRLHFDADALQATLHRAGFMNVETSTSSSSVGLAASIHYATIGRFLSPSGWALRLIVAAWALGGPVGWLADRVAGEGDVLHAVASKS
jgi:SAM-dependent methyltransferase